MQKIKQIWVGKIVYILLSFDNRIETESFFLARIESFNKEKEIAGVTLIHSMERVSFHIKFCYLWEPVVNEHGVLNIN
jgi:hypothetical protein